MAHLEEGEEKLGEVKKEDFDKTVLIVVFQRFETKKE